MKVAIINCFDTFLARELALIRYFEERGDDVTAFLSDFCHIKKSYREDAPAGINLIHTTKYKKNLSVDRIYSHIKFSHLARTALESGHWDLIWVIVPPNSLVKQCALYCRKHPHTKLIYDINDLWPESLPLDDLKKLPPFRVWRNIRDCYLAQADFIVTECDLFKNKLSYINGINKENCKTIYLCKQENSLRSYNSKRSWSNDTFDICYLGSINHIIDIDAIAEILMQLSKLRPVKLHIIGAGETKSDLINRAKNNGVEVIDHGIIYDDTEKQHIFDQCHFGLNFMKSTVCVGLTMKSIDYLAAGLPIINNIPGDTWDLINREGFGLNWNAENPIDIDKIDLSEARLAARKFFECELSYTAFAQRIDQVIGSL